MKKIILSIIGVFLVFALAGCSQPKESEQTSAADNSSNNEAAVTTYFGQIADIVGNNITVSLGELKIDNEENDNETYIVDENGDMRPADKDELGEPTGETMIIAVPEDETGTGEENDTATNPAETLPIEFTGEVREFTIPAGARIMNFAGKEVSMDSISKGTLIQFTVNTENNTIEKIIVM